MLWRLCGFADQYAVGGRSCAGADAEQGIEGGMACSAPIEAEPELVKVMLEVCFAQSVIHAQAPTLEVRKQPMDPGQRDVCRHRAEGDRVVPDTRKVLVGRPVVGDQLGLRGDSAEHESMKFLFAKSEPSWSPTTGRPTRTF